MSRYMRAIGVLVASTTFVLSLLFVYRYTVGAKTLTWIPYAYSELLINYSAGFVRRGLLGAFVAHFVHGTSSLRATNLVVFANFAVLTACLSVLALLKSRYKFWTTSLVLLIPGGVFHMAFNKEMFYRKEVFFFGFLSVVGVGLSIARLLPQGASRKALANCLVALLWCGGIACSLVHEAFIFLAGGAATYLLIACMRLVDQDEPPDRKTDLKENRLAALFIGLMAASFFITSVFFHGGGNGAMGVWFRLPPGDRDLIAPAGLGGLGSLGAGLPELWNLPLMVFQTGLTWWYVAPITLLFLYCTVLVALNLKDSETDGRNLLRWVRCYATLALAAIPTFWLGWDWGRWTCSLTSSFLLVWLSLREDDLFHPLPRLRLNPLEGWLARRGLNDLPQSLASSGALVVRRHASITVCCLLVFALTFRLPELLLADAYIFIGRSATDYMTLMLQRHTHLVHY